MFSITSWAVQSATQPESASLVIHQNDRKYGPQSPDVVPTTVRSLNKTAHIILLSTMFQIDFWNPFYSLSGKKLSFETFSYISDTSKDLYLVLTQQSFNP